MSSSNYSMRNIIKGNLEHNLLSEQPRLPQPLVTFEQNPEKVGSVATKSGAVKRGAATASSKLPKDANNHIFQHQHCTPQSFHFVYTYLGQGRHHRKAHGYPWILAMQYVVTHATSVREITILSLPVFYVVAALYFSYTQIRQTWLNRKDARRTVIAYFYSVFQIFVTALGLVTVDCFQNQPRIFLTYLTK